MATSLCVQDHVVLLLSPKEFESPPSWLSDNFNIREGGVHAGRSSQNKLIVFADGTYLELFCWIDTPREFHAWANKSPGLIDFALTSLPPSTAQSLHNDVRSRLTAGESTNELHISYTSPEAGGRSRKDGVEVKWHSSRPISSEYANRTDYPFFCHDVTPRHVRVPFEDLQKTTHPCGAIGISTVEVLVPRLISWEYSKQYSLILGVPPRIYDGWESSRRSDFELGLPNQGFAPSTVSLRSEQNEKERDCLHERGAGICGLILSVVGRESHGKESLGAEGIASTISLKW